MSYQIIETPAQLASVCEFLKQSPTTLMLDTEFIRTRTYYAKLGLLQIFDGEQCYLVDPVAVDLEKSEFWTLLQQHHWVFHAFGEDLELLARYVMQFGLSVFDTQVAAAFLGHGISLGYQGLIQQTTGVLLDKGESRTDWLARPLTSRQVEYAAKDVLYLRPAYIQLVEELQTKGLYDYVVQECLRLSQLRCQQPDFENAYIDIKNAWRLNRQQLAVLQKLASWRLRTAIQRDMPVNNVVHADKLWTIAKNQPMNKQQLKLTGIKPQAFRIHAQQLLNLVSEGQDVIERDRPEKIKRMIDYPHYKETLEAIKNLAMTVEEENGVPADVLAPKRLIHELMIWQWQLTPEKKAHKQPPVLISGWREALLAPRLLKLF